MFVSLAAVVVAVLKAMGPKSPGVAENCCGAIGNMAFFDATNRTALDAAGACEGE